MIIKRVDLEKFSRFAYLQAKFFCQDQLSEKPKINRLKEVLKEMGIKHNELAKQMGVSPNTITRMYNNVPQPHLEFLREMAIELNVEVCELIVPI